MLATLYLFFGYVTSYVGYFIGYITNVLLLVERSPDLKHTTAPGGSKKIEEVVRPPGAASPILPTDRFCGTNSTCDVIYRPMFARGDWGGGP